MVAAADIQMKEHAVDSDYLFGIVYAVYPEARKAVLMATATQDVDGNPLDWDDYTVDDKDGAGELNACAAAMLSDVQYSRHLDGSDPYAEAGVALFVLDTSECDPFCPQIGKVKVPAGDWVKVVLSWLVDVDCSWTDGGYDCISGVPQDFNLAMICSGGVVQLSMSSASAYEYIEWKNETETDKECDIMIWWYGSEDGVYPAGLAFVTSSQVQEWGCGVYD